MASSSTAAERIRKARQAAAAPGRPGGEEALEQVKEEQKAEFHGPTTAMLDAMQPFNIEGGEGKVHEMQARQAKTAAAQAMKEAGRHLLNIADVRPLVREHPLLALGGAAAVGFAAAALLVPSEKQRAAGRLRALERALRDEAAAGGKAFARTPSTTGRLMRLGLRLARPTLLSMVTGALSGAASGAASGSQAGAESGQRTGADAAEDAAGDGGPLPDAGPISDVT